MESLQEVLIEQLILLLGHQFDQTLATSDQIDQLSAELAVRSKLPEYVVDAINALPSDLHPMSQFSIGILAM